MQLQMCRKVWFGILFGFVFGASLVQAEMLSGLDPSKATPWALLFSVLVDIVAIPMGIAHGIFGKEVAVRQVKVFGILIGVATLVIGILLGIDVSSVRTDASLARLIILMTVAEISGVIGAGILTFLFFVVLDLLFSCITRLFTQAPRFPKHGPEDK